jgi:hypothetical protein
MIFETLIKAGAWSLSGHTFLDGVKLGEFVNEEFRPTKAGLELCRVLSPTAHPPVSEELAALMKSFDDPVAP